MKLRLFLPPERAEAAPIAWKLLDTRHAVLRDGVSPPSELPRAGEVEIVLPAERVLFARLKLPRVNAATIRELLPYAVEDRLLEDPSQVHAVAGRTNARGETVVAVIDRAALNEILGMLRRAGLRPAHAWCETALVPARAGEWHVVLRGERGLLVDDEGVGATFDRGPALPLSVRIALDEAAQRGERPRAIRVHGDATPAELERWSAEASVPFAGAGDAQALAGRTVARDAIDLLQGEFAPRSAAARFALPRAALILAAAIALVQLAFTAADTWRLGRESRALEARREAIFRAAFPEARVVVDPELQMARNLAELQRARGVAAGDEFLAQLSRAAQGSRGPVRAIDYANGRLSTR